MLLSIFRTQLKAYSLQSMSPVLIGVSGGADSLALLDLFCRTDVPIVAAHFNHGLRPEAGADARRVALLAETMSIPFVSGEMDVAAYARQHSLSIEEAARVCRYTFLFEQASFHGAQAVAVGHHADDQAETVVMHFLRGAGLSGLKGMRTRLVPNPWSAEISLLRPLLGVTREAIRAYCQARGLQPIDDATNLDTTLFRNQLRHKTLPYLDSLIPGIHQRLGQMAEILTADEDVLIDVTEQAGRDALLERGAGFLVFNRQLLADDALGIQRRIIRWAAEQLRPNLRDLDFAAVQRALTVLNGEARGTDLALEIRALSEGERFYLAAREADLPSKIWPQLGHEDDLLYLPVPGELSLPDGWLLHCHLPDDVDHARGQALENGNPFRAWVDVGEQPPTQLQIRTRYPGDRIQPLGMEGTSVKLSDLMINAKIPKRARARWPLLLAGERILWVPGLRVSHEYRVCEKSQVVVSPELEPGN